MSTHTRLACVVARVWRLPRRLTRTTTALGVPGSVERLDWIDACGVPVDVAIDTLLDYNPQTSRSDLDARFVPQLRRRPGAPSRSSRPANVRSVRAACTRTACGRACGGETQAPARRFLCPTDALHLQEALSPPEALRRGSPV